MRLFALSLCQILIISNVMAVPVPQTPIDSSVPDQSFEPEMEEVQPEQGDIEVLEWSRDWLHDYVESLNHGVDSFFMGGFFDEEIINDESSGSNGRLFFTSRRVKGQPWDLQTGINLKLSLPKSSNRFKLLVETDENDDGQTESDVLGTTENVTYSTAIRVEIREGRRWTTSWDNGVRWAGEPVYFSRLRARRTDYFDEWRSRILQSVFWRTDVEWGALMNAGLLRPIDLRRHLRFGLNVDYLLSNDFAEIEGNVGIFDELSPRSAMLYQLATFGDTEHLSKVTNTVLSVSYRRKIYKHFVFAEVVPEVAWPRENDYEATQGITFRLEMIFGPEAY